MATADKSTQRGYPLERRDDGRQRFHGCSRITDYDYLCKLGEGTFGEVSKARSKKTGQIVALKKILMHNEKDGFPITALREIKLLKQLDHVNVLKLEEMAVERSKNLTKKSSMFMVTPYMEHDLSGLLQNPAVTFTEPQIKCYLKQLLEGCAYLHENRILHRDMKAANLLISNHGILQIADFGLARPYDDEPPKAGKGGGEATREYTTLVVTRWYRPPELLLQLRKYTTAIDMWGVGCVFGEMFKRKPILAGDSDLNQALMIFDLVGSPTDDTMPGWRDLPGCDNVRDYSPRRSTIQQAFKDQSTLAVSLLSEFLKLDWRKRINAIDALKHPYLNTAPFPARPQDLPQFEDSHELDRRKFRDQKAKPPQAPAPAEHVGVVTQGEWGINGRPYDARGPGRNPRNFQNGHGRRMPPDGGRGQDRDYHQPRPYDQPYERNRPLQPHDENYNRRPLPAQDMNLPPRPPPSDNEYNNYRDDRPYRDDGKALPPRSRAPGGQPDNRRQEKAPVVDTYIPSYSNADPYARPPPNVLRESRGRRPRDDRPQRGKGDLFDEGLRYDEAGNPPSGEFRRRQDSSGSIGAGAGPGPGAGPGGYERRRSRSPQRRSPLRDVRDRDRDRDRDRERDRERGYPPNDHGIYRR